MWMARNTSATAIPRLITSNFYASVKKLTKIGDYNMDLFPNPIIHDLATFDGEYFFLLLALLLLLLQLLEALLLLLLPLLLAPLPSLPQINHKSLMVMVLAKEV